MHAASAEHTTTAETATTPVRDLTPPRLLIAASVGALCATRTPAMREDERVNEYPQQLADAVQAVLASWLVRCVTDTARTSPSGLTTAILELADDMSRSASAVVMQELYELLDTDVDAQRANPLSVMRAAVRYPTEVLHAAGVAPVRRDAFAVRNFPDDIYNLSPAAWGDIDESLLEPGLVWGAWKAKVVLERRRDQAVGSACE